MVPPLILREPQDERDVRCVGVGMNEGRHFDRLRTNGLRFAP
jgi:hypothetical protein